MSPGKHAAATILVSIITVLMTSPSTSACPSSCEMCGSQAVWCGGAELTTFPSDLPHNISLLYLVNNNISYIGTHAVKGFRSTLKSLYMLNNKLNYESIESGGFKMFSELETLELNHNLFTSIRPDLLSGMNKLTNLQMMHNRISRIYPGAFANLTRLTDIQLSGNRIITLPQFPDLPLLNRLLLDGNKISKLQYSFRKLKSLKILQIANNSLSELNGDQFPKDNPITNLRIQQNNFREVPQAIREMPELVELNLGGNPISVLPTDLLDYSLHLKYLDVSDCKLREVGANFIPRHLIFNTIYIAGNPWKCDCGIKHLLRFIKNTPSFKDTNEAKCSLPLSERGILIKDLDMPGMNCKSETRIPQSPVISMDVDCSKLTCENGGTCVIGIGGVAMCRCTADWRGDTCVVPNTNHLPIPKPTEKVDANTTLGRLVDSLLLQEGSITTRTVTIFVPQTNSEYLIRVSEIINDKGDMLERQKYKIKPDHRAYVVGDLASGATYRVCLGSVSIAEEEMCSTVRTTVRITPNQPNPPLPLPTEPTILLRTPEKEDVIDPVLPVNPRVIPPVYQLPRPVDPSTFDIHHKNAPDTGESLANFDTGLSVKSEAVQDQSVYLLIGAGIGAFVILLFGAMIFVFLRNKRLKLRSSAAGSSDSAGGGSDDTRRYTDIVGHETEMTPLAVDNGITYQHRTTPSPANPSIYYKQQQHALTSRIISYHQPAAAVTNNNGEVYHLTDAGSCRTGAGSPNRNTGSLGRSSISGGSVGVVQPLSLYEQQQHNRGYSPLTNNTGGNSVIGELMDDIQYVAVSGRGSYTTGSPLPMSHPVVQQRVGVPQHQQINMYGHRDSEPQRARNPSEMSRQSPMIAPDPTAYPRPPSVRGASTTSINHQFHAPPIVASRIGHQTYTPGHMQQQQQQMHHPSLQPQHQPQRSSRQSYSGQIVQVPASPCLLTDNYNRGGVLMPKVRGME